MCIDVHAHVAIWPNCGPRLGRSVQAEGISGCRAYSDQPSLISRDYSGRERRRGDTSCWHFLRLLSLNTPLALYGLSSLLKETDTVVNATTPLSFICTKPTKTPVLFPKLPGPRLLAILFE